MGLKYKTVTKMNDTPEIRPVECDDKIGTWFKPGDREMKYKKAFVGLLTTVFFAATGMAAGDDYSARPYQF